MAEPLDRESRMGRNVGVGCVMTLAGFFSGGMTGVLLSKIVDFFLRHPACADLPSCDWGKYFVGGALVGAVSLPWLVLNRLRRTDATDNSQRG